MYFNIADFRLGVELFHCSRVYQTDQPPVYFDRRAIVKGCKVT